MITDYGNIRIGDKVFEDVPLQKDIFGKVFENETQICEIIRLVDSGKSSVWVTFQPTNGSAFALLKRITTKCMVVD
jgi:hypothetical protein